MSRVLVVDDEAPILRALTANLRARKYEWDAAATGEDALRLAAKHHPDAVVLDLGLPGMSGIEVIRGLRGWTAVPIIVLSARAADKVAALDAGPTTTSRSRSAWTSCSSDCGPLSVASHRPRKRRRHYSRLHGRPRRQGGDPRR